MSHQICSLNSGSNGNCYYIANQKDAVLVDVGLSCKEVEKRMGRLGLNITTVKAIFISHEHIDHIKGVSVLSRKYNLPVYITAATHQSSGLFLLDTNIHHFKANQPIQIGGIVVTAFPKFHDCAEPHSFVVSGNGINIGVFTDIGSVCDNVINNFKLCHAVFLESNYDDDMLEKGNYPWHLKNRIRSSHGHLSNAQALELFLTHKPAFMSHVLLSHLSRDNNHPQLVYDLFKKHAAETFIGIASRDEATAVFTVTDAVFPKPSLVKLPISKVVQTTLF
jgi:phosphoribosyl 1,2-cyclic phosphodiesterase